MLRCPMQAPSLRQWWSCTAPPTLPYLQLNHPAVLTVSHRGHIPRPNSSLFLFSVRLVAGTTAWARTWGGPVPPVPGEGETV